MFRVFLLVTGLLASISAAAWCPDYLDHTMRKLHSQDDIDLCALTSDKPVLIVDTASHCGYTPQFKSLEALYQHYRQQGLQVIGFASDDFRQEADSEAEAATVCYVNYGVTFTMLAPTHVRGPSANPVFAALQQQAQPPAWNFNKYLVAGDCTLVEHFGSNIAPDSPLLKRAIESLLQPRGDAL